MNKYARLLEATSISKSFNGIRALSDVSLSIDPGEVVCLLGANGAGKTTLMSILAGFLPADDGRVQISGLDVARHPQQTHKALGIAPQETGVYPMLDVRSNLRLFCELGGLRGRAAANRIDNVVDSLLLTKLTGRRVQELSGGEQRRLHVAIALVHHPTLLLLDEPSVGADIATRRQLLQLVRDLALEGCGILYSTHYLHEVETLDCSVMILNEGVVVARGTIDDVLATDDAVVLEFIFSGPAPSMDLALLGEASMGMALVTDGLRITTREPGLSAARVLSALGNDVTRLKSVNTIRPTLEDIVVSFTGDEGGGAPTEVHET